MVLFTNEQSTQGGAFSGYLLDQKSKSPLFTGGIGGHGYNDYCIIITKSLKCKNKMCINNKRKLRNAKWILHKIRYKKM